MKIIILLSFCLFSLKSYSKIIDLDHGPQELLTQCSRDQLSKIREAEKATLLRLDQILRDWAFINLQGVKESYVLPHNRKWIEGSPMNKSYDVYWHDMGKVLNRMKEKSDRGLKFSCQTMRDKQCEGGDTIAYVVRIFGRTREMIYLCPTFFEDGSSYSTTIFHELSHYAAGTEDYMLEWWNLARSDLKKAAMDAYHVEKFMNQDVNEELKRSIWMWWWPKSVQSN